MSVNETTFVADVKSWVEAILARRPDLPYGRATVEEHSVGNSKRLDFIIYRRGTSQVALTGEVKMPDNPQGRSPLGQDLVEDAFEKASRLGSPHYFTWNVRTLALFQTHKDSVPFMDRLIEQHEVVAVSTSDDTRRADVQERIQAFWVGLLERLRALELGQQPIRNLPLDRRFIIRLEGDLEDPIESTFQKVRRQWPEDNVFRNQLSQWMRDEQGWELSDHPDRLRDNLERASRLSCYSLANKLIFFEVLRRRFRTLPPLAAMQPASADELAQALERRFREAVSVSKDYETIFAAADYASILPFLPDNAVAAWGRVILNIEDFDFTRLDYDIIGRMYEGLIQPEERRRFGQFFTAPEVVDLINAFCIRSAGAKVLDPSCGGGTFLVRAYARLKTLAQQDGIVLPHVVLLKQLSGVDVAAVPAQLSTLNLAVRHLSDEPNYPQVAKRDFFEVRAGQPIIRLPIAGTPEQLEDVVLSELDAVVGNPPYIRQEELTADYKQRLELLAKEDWRRGHPVRLSGRSDIYAHFFSHAGALLKDGGYIGLVTSVGWLDTDYGFRLQSLFLQNFRIVAIIESQVDKWFEDARVTTAVTILQRESSESLRMDNLVRFVFLKRPLADLYGMLLKESAGSDIETKRQQDAEDIRTLIEKTDYNENTGDWRVRVVRQRDLWQQGCRARLAFAGEGLASDDSDYKAGKWGQHLRGPNVWFELLDRCSEHFVPLYDLAIMRRGFTSGIDKFYCIRDVTEQALKKTTSGPGFKEKWGISREETATIRIIQDGDEVVHLVEARFLEPEFHRLTDAHTIVVRAGDVAKKVINAPVSPAELRGTHLGRYVAYAESQHWDQGSTVLSRARNRPWYDLGLAEPGQRAEIFWSMTHQYRHLAPLNPDRLPSNHNLFDLWAHDDIDSEALWAMLNSTVVALSKHQFGRMAGIEGALKTEVVDVNMMLVPDLRGADPSITNRAVLSAQSIASRHLPRTLVDDFERSDRQELDDAVLEILGISESQDRKELRERLYAALEQQYVATRARELVAQKDRSRSHRKGGDLSPADLAMEIWLDHKDELSLLEFPSDFVHQKGKISFDLPPGRVEVGTAMLEDAGHLRAGTIRVGGASGTVIDVETVPRARFLAAVAECGVYGSLELPSEADCDLAVANFGRYRIELQTKFQELATQYTPNDRKAKTIAGILLRLALQWRR